MAVHVRTCTPRFCISGTARPIVFKFGVWVWGHYQTVGVSLHVRTSPHFRISWERLGRLCSNLVCRLGAITEVLPISHGWGESSRAHVPLESHQKQVYIFRVRSFIAKHGVLLVNGSFHVKSPKKVPFWPRPPSISAKIGEPIAPHERNMYAQF